MSPHIATLRDYPPFVLSAEAEESPGFRSVLKVRFKRERMHHGRRLAVCIFANPSAADKDGGDHTVNKALSFLYHGHPGLMEPRDEVWILNLCPARATHAAEMRKALNSPAALDVCNAANEPAMEALQNALLGALDLVVWVGWGDCLGRHTAELAAPFIAALQGSPVWSLPPTKADNPTHPARAALHTLRRSVLWPKPVIGPLVGCDTSPDADVPF